MPNIPILRATKVSAPPAWALLERELMAANDQAALMFTDRYFERGGAPIWADDVDDFYEAVYNWACNTPWAAARRC